MPLFPEYNNHEKQNDYAYGSEKPGYSSKEKYGGEGDEGTSSLSWLYMNNGYEEQINEPVNSVKLLVAKWLESPIVSFNSTPNLFFFFFFLQNIHTFCISRSTFCFFSFFEIQIFKKWASEENETVYSNFLNEHSFQTFFDLPPDHLLLDRSPNIGPFVSCWELDKFKNW